MDKIRLHGFNNLTKTLSFNIYDVCYACSDAQITEYMNYIDEAYNADRLTQILEEVAHLIGANILNIAKTDYEPMGASVTMLISEEMTVPEGVNNSATPGPMPDAVVAHMDKSHLTVHTYPESHPYFGISTFRADIDVSTCGMISPLKVLNYLIHSFESDIVMIDYRVRGFTRDISGDKHFIDHKINSIQNYISDSTKERYQMIDANIYQEQIFHTKMVLNHFDLDDYLFQVSARDLGEEQRNDIEAKLKQEMMEIFYGRNM
ncbi:MAG: adenosylmethionine decarboxylase [Gammaproteobacteria bacterium]